MQGRASSPQGETGVDGLVTGVEGWGTEGRMGLKEGRMELKEVRMGRQRPVRRTLAGRRHLGGLGRASDDSRRWTRRRSRRGLTLRGLGQQSTSTTDRHTECTRTR